MPFYSAIDAYHMTACTIDEAVRRLLAVGGRLDHIGGVDNFCWPSIQYHPEKNPDGKFKAAQLVRSCRALRDLCLMYEIPLLSGKDSMYVDGYLAGGYGEMHKISALETLQFSATSVIDDVGHCITMDAKVPGDLVYVLGTTRNELGASEYYEHFGYIGARVPKVRPDESKRLYKVLAAAMEQNLVASAHGIYRGGLGVHLALTAMGGELGMEIDLSAMPFDGVDREDALLFSETPGRFIVTIDPKNQAGFDELFAGNAFGLVGKVTGPGEALVVRGLSDPEPLINVPVATLKAAWKAPLGELV